MNDDEVVVVVFADQKTTSEGERSMVAKNRVAVTMVPGDNGWLVDGVAANGPVEASDPDPARMAAMAAAKKFCLTWHTFSPSTAKEYVDTVTPLLSSTLATEFSARLRTSSPASRTNS